jgi:hypothetical protein
LSLTEAVEKLIQLSTKLQLLQPMFDLSESDSDTTIIDKLCNAVKDGLDEKYMPRTLIDGKLQALNEVLNLKILSVSDDFKRQVDIDKRNFAIKKDIQDLKGELAGMVSDADFVKQVGLLKTQM